MGRRRRTLVVVAAAAAAMAAFACGSATEPRTTPSNATTAATADRASATAIASAVAPTPAASATNSRVPAAPTATPPASGDTGIAGIVTIGPTCPVERIDSPCPDRPYEARITIWQGDILVAETRSGPDGRFTVRLSPGEYRVVGESGDTFPHGSEVTVTVTEGHVAPIEIRFDSGIR